MAITYFGRTAVPADGAAATNATTTISFTPPASMVAGDLVVVYLQQRGTATFSNTTTGGQTWNALTRRTGTSIAVQGFWCRFNGTWAADPVFTFSAGTCTSGVMNVFRPTASGSLFAVDQSEAAGTFTAGSTPFTKTITGITNARTSSVTLAAWYTADDNTWGTLSGTGWAVTGDAQYRNTASTDQSMTFAHRLLSAAGATGNVSLNQLTLGGDAGITTLVSFYEYKELSVPLLTNSGGTPTAPVIDAVTTATSTAGVSAPALTGVPANNLLVLSIAQESDNGAGNVTSVVSSPSLTWTKRVDSEAASSGNAELWTAPFAAGGNITVTVTWSISSEVRTTLYSVSNYNTSLNAGGSTATAQTAPSVGITTSEANGLIFAVTSDFAAVDGASRAYRDSATERYYQFVSTKFTAYHYTKAAATAATYTEGLTAPSTMAAGTSLYVVKGLAGAADTLFAPTLTTGQIESGSGSSTGTSTVSSTIQGTGNTSVSSAGTSTATANIQGTGSVTANSTGTSSASSIITASIEAAGSSTGTSSASGTIEGTINAAADSIGTSTAGSSLYGTGNATASSIGLSTISASIIGMAPTSGESAGTSSALGVLQSINETSGASTGASSASSNIEAKGVAVADSIGTSTSSAIGETLTGLTAQSYGVSSATANIIGIGTIVAASSGVSSASGTIEELAYQQATGSSLGSSSASSTITGTGITTGNIASLSTASANIIGIAEAIGVSEGTSNCFIELIIYEQGTGVASGTSTCFATINGALITVKSISVKRNIQQSIREKSKLTTSINHQTFFDEFI